MDKIITNNVKVREFYKDRYDILFIEGSYGDVLSKVRDLVHKGCVILTHPLSGSVKPAETPFESVVVSDCRGKLHYESLELIEHAVDTFKKFSDMKGNIRKSYTEDILNDFRSIDFSLIYSALR